MTEWLRKLPDPADALLMVGVTCIVASVGWRFGAVYGLGALGVLSLAGGYLLGRSPTGGGA